MIFNLFKKKAPKAPVKASGKSKGANVKKSSLIGRFEASGMTKAAVSRATGIPYPMVHAYVTGKTAPRAKNEELLAKVM